MSDKLLKPLLDYLSNNDISSKLRPPPNSPMYRLKDIFTAQKGRVPETLCSDFNNQTKPYINIKAFERGIYDYYVQSDDGVSVYDDELVIVWDGARSGLVGKGRNGILGSTLKKLTLKPVFSKSLLPYFYFFSSAAISIHQSNGTRFGHKARRSDYILEFGNSNS